MRCYLCGGVTQLSQDTPWKVKVCPECGLSEVIIKRQHKYEIGNLQEHLQLSSPLTKLTVRLGGKWLLAWYYRVVYGRRRRLVEHLVSQGSLLDVGCESGTFLAQFGGEWQLAGVEINKQVAAQASKAVQQANIYAMGVEQLKTRTKYDVVTMWHVLEHLADPKKVLGQVARLTRPGGYVVIEVPNGQSVWRGVFGRQWRLWMYPQHRWFWTDQALRRLVEAVGFEAMGSQAVGWLSCASSSLADRWGLPWLGLVTIPLFVVVNIVYPPSRDNLRVVARRK